MGKTYKYQKTKEQETELQEIKKLKKKKENWRKKLTEELTEEDLDRVAKFGFI